MAHTVPKRTGSFYRFGQGIVNTGGKEDKGIGKTVKGCVHGAGYPKKGHRHLLQERQLRYGFILENSSQYPVGKMCKCLKVSSKSYYQWKITKGRQGPGTTQKNLKDDILRIWEESNKIYGSPKITAQLRREGRQYHRSYIARLMKDLGIKSITRRKYIATTDSRHSNPVAENSLNRAFAATDLGKIWVSDITYIRCAGKWVYLTSMIDLADRKVVGWSLSHDLSTENTVYKAYIQALNQRPVKKGFVLHSDRGVQYTSEKITNLFKYNKNADQSMSRKGNCWDNAVAESFFKTIKCELIYQQKFNSFEEVYLKVYKYITWYNTKRLHQALNYKTPLQVESELLNKHLKLSA